MKAINDIRLTLFFTRRMGLHHWDRVGNLQREVAIYQALGQRLKAVQFITYGGRQDRPYAARLTPITVHPTPGYLPVLASQLIFPQQYRILLEKSDIFKTNQIPGAEIALWAKRKYGKKLIVRCGYLYSRFMEAHTSNRFRIRRAYQLEKMAFSHAEAGIVTSERDRKWIIQTHGIRPEKIHVIPNYVVTDVFKPLSEHPKKYDLVCVSKASPQKNLSTLLTALNRLKQTGHSPSLLLIGSAGEDVQLRQQVERLKLQVTFIRRVVNFALPIYLNQARAFILPSLYEGHPKALLEAMSCGLPCIGTDVPGIQDDLQHKKNGYLCQTTPASLAEAIQTVLSDVHLQTILGDNARLYIMDRYSLSKVLDLELTLIEQVLQSYQK